MKGMAEHVIGQTGASYRQLDYWSRAGYLRVPSGPKGRAVQTGIPRMWPSEEIVVARTMLRLVRVGFSAAAAAKIARAFVEDPYAETVGRDAVELKLAQGLVLRVHDVEPPSPPSQESEPRVDHPSWDAEGRL